MTATQTNPRYLSEWGTYELDVLASLYRHRLLTTTQVHDLHQRACSRRWVQKTLKRLETGGFLARVVGRPPGREARWFCTSSGVDVAENSGDVLLHSFRMDADKAVSGYSKHLLAVNDVGIALTNAAAKFGDEFDSGSWQHEVAHRYGPDKNQLIADALLTYDVVSNHGVTAERRFVELDRGTMRVHDLVDKMFAYNQYYFWEPKKTDADAHLPRRAWKRKYVAFPGVAFVFAGLTAKQAQRRTERLAGFLSTDSRFTNNVEAVATTVDALSNSGPFEPVCIDLTTGKPAPLFN